MFKEGILIWLHSAQPCPFWYFPKYCQNHFPQHVFFFHIPMLSNYFFLQVVPCLQFPALYAFLPPLIYQLHLLCLPSTLLTPCWTEAKIQDKALSTGIKLCFPSKKQNKTKKTTFHSVFQNLSFPSLYINSNLRIIDLEISNWTYSLLK